MRRTLLVVVATFALGWSACSTPPPGSASPPSPSLSPAAALAPGLTQKQVRELWGAPADVRPFQVPGGDRPSEIWIYRRPLAETERQVIIGTHEIPAINPRTGLPITINEPDYAPQVVTVTEIVELLFVDQRLVETKSRREEQSRILNR